MRLYLKYTDDIIYTQEEPECRVEINITADRGLIVYVKHTPRERNIPAKHVKELCAHYDGIIDRIPRSDMFSVDDITSPYFCENRIIPLPSAAEIEGHGQAILAKIDDTIYTVDRSSLYVYNNYSNYHLPITIAQLGAILGMYESMFMSA